MDLQLVGKRALVTGATSGIGAGIAAMLAAEGASVIVHGRDVQRARQVSNRIGSAGGKAACAIGDLTKDAMAAAVAEQALEAFGGIDILVNCAGGRPPRLADLTQWDQLTAVDWEETYAINVVAAVRMVNLLVPRMRERGWGRIVNISSIGGQTISASVPEYCATKAAMTASTLALSKKLAGTGITANTISPGVIRTEALERFIDTIAAEIGKPGDRVAGEAFLRTHNVPQTVHRLGEPDDIAAMVCFLASPRSDFITGANIRVDGGGSPAVN